MSAPLSGTNLVRLTYLDEAGTDASATAVTVAGVMVHGDHEWPEIDKRIDALVEKYVPESDRVGFHFHATDIYHGSGYFDRRKPEWPEDRRLTVLSNLAQIIRDMHLPVVSGSYRKKKYAADAPQAHRAPADRLRHMHGICILDCLRDANRWLWLFAPQELSTVVHEDLPNTKALFKICVRMVRSEKLLEQNGIDAKARRAAGLPLKHIIDTVHFAEKADAKPLQLADLCAWVLNRSIRGKPVPKDVFAIVREGQFWVPTNEKSKLTPAPGAFSEQVS